MKKILFAAAALVAMASCATDDVVSRPADEVIDFAEAFVENSTRANDIKKDNLSQFNVYGSVNANGTNGFIFTDQEVNKSGDAYTYTPAQYWIPAAEYKFTAFASLTSTQTVARQWSFAEGADAANGVISFNNAAAEANQDLVYAYAERDTEETIASKPAPVAFTFNHMLSRVKFTITNGFTDGSNIELDITDLTITNAHSNGTLAVVDGETQTWAVGTEVFARNFGSKEKLADNNTSWTTEHFYLIPAEATYNVEFDVTLHQAGVEVDTYSRTATVTLDLEKGKSYNIKATLNTSNTSDDGSEIYPIEFTVDAVENWENFGDVDATIPEHVVSTADELATAVAEGGAIVLTQNIDLDMLPTTLANERYAGLTISKNTVIDGAGFTVKTTAVRALQFIEGAKNVTIKNLTLDAPNSERGFQFQADGHNVVIENVTATSGNYTVYLTATSTNSNVVVKNCDLTGLNTINVWGKDHKVNVENTKITTIDNNAAEGYAPIYNTADNTTVYVNGGEVVITGNNAEDTVPGLICGSANIVFNGTKGDCYVEGHNFAINYANGYRYTFPTFEAALSYAKAGETIVLLQDVNLTEPVVITKEVIVDLNGKKISSATDVFEVASGALTIIGDGEVYAATTNGEPYCAVWAYGNAVVNIYGGDYKIGSPTGDYNDLIYAKDNAVINIYGGKFYNSGKENSFVLNVKDGSAADINVYGGSYEKFNPANNESEGPNTNFVVDGKTVEQNNDWYIVK